MKARRPHAKGPSFRIPNPAFRDGKVLVMTAALMPVLVGGLAVSVDTAILAASRAQLSTAADAAALAGARQLASQQHLSGGSIGSAEINAAVTQAIAFAGQNNALNSGVAL